MVIAPAHTSCLALSGSLTVTTDKTETPAAHPSLKTHNTLPQRCRRPRAGSTFRPPATSLVFLSLIHSSFFFFIQGQLRLGVPCIPPHSSCADPHTSSLSTGNLTGHQCTYERTWAKKEDPRQTNSSAPFLPIKCWSWPCSPQNQLTSYSSGLSFAGSLSPAPQGVWQADTMGTESQIHHQHHLSEATAVRARLPRLLYLTRQGRKQLKEKEIMQFYNDIAGSTVTGSSCN